MGIGDGIGGEDFSELPGAEAVPGGDEGSDEGGVAEAADEEFLSGREHGGRALRVEGEELVKAHAGGNPGEGEHEKVAGDDEGEDRANGDAHPADEAALCGITGEVVAGEANDNRSEEGNEEEHDGRESVEEEIDPEGAVDFKTES